MQGNWNLSGSDHSQIHLPPEKFSKSNLFRLQRECVLEKEKEKDTKFQTQMDVEGGERLAEIAANQCQNARTDKRDRNRDSGRETQGFLVL